MPAVPPLLTDLLTTIILLSSQHYPIFHLSVLQSLSRLLCINVCVETFELYESSTIYFNISLRDSMELREIMNPLLICISL